MKKSILLIACTFIMGAAMAQTKPVNNVAPAKQGIKKEVVANGQKKQASSQRKVAGKQKRQAINSIKNDQGKPAAAAQDLAVAKKNYRKDQRIKARDCRALKRDENRTPPVTNPSTDGTTSN